MPTSKDEKAVIKNNSDYMIISADISYSKKLILPYKDGLSFLAALDKAELYRESYGKETTITDVERKDIEITTIGFQEYAETKLKSILKPEN
jgi:hypothetical protein